MWNTFVIDKTEVFCFFGISLLGFVWMCFQVYRFDEKWKYLLDSALEVSTLPYAWGLLDHSYSTVTRQNRRIISAD